MRGFNEILTTGARNSDESALVREAGYAYHECRWCHVIAYVKNGLCWRCATADAGRDRGTAETMPTTVVHCRKEPYDVYIGRRVGRYGLPQSRWANPFPLAMGTREQVIEAYRQHLLDSPDLLAALPELVGKRLGCWCAPKACHGDVLVELIRERLGED